MSSLYLRWLVREQIDRAALLKDVIPARPRHAALARLAAACRDALDGQAQRLERARALPDGAGMPALPGR